ncbi:MAG: hypothetical protein A2W09_07800 [Deltaproteobacteria bacterium RBG_16_50_11]|nr:MAG: hypothetical protein A2W09_07800 [Deltaproteobacteria bacterium RBG_16_50_11]
MLRRVPPYEACGGATGFSPWGLHFLRRIVHFLSHKTFSVPSSYQSNRIRSFPSFLILIKSD